MFSKLNDGWERSDLTLRQRCYEAAEVRMALDGTGFAEIQIFERDQNGSLSERDGEIERAFFVCRKPKEANR